MGFDPPPPRQCDAAVVGGGIIGLAVARELLRRRPGARVCVLEAEDDVGTHQTGRSSGVVHAGIYYAPGSLKARLCVEGASRLYRYCEDHGIDFERSGKLIVASEEAELPRLAALERHGRANQVPGLRPLAADEIGEVEPHARGVAALHSPATGVVDFAEVARAYASDLTRGGGTVHLGVRVAAASPAAGGTAVRHSQGVTVARHAVFCAGLWADRLAVACGGPEEPRIVPFRGAYLRLRRGGSNLVRGNVYPVPDPELPFLGTHLTRTIGGEVLVGPSALLAPSRDAYRLRTVRGRDLLQTLGWPGTWRLAARHWRAGLAELRRTASRRSFVAAAARLVPELRAAGVEPGPVGIRAQALDRHGGLVDDFVIQRTEGAVHVRNAPSPAATASLVLAELIADELER
jgi:(S)-2-hydroxyglutarate dehydrogenase